MQPSPYTPGVVAREVPGRLNLLTEFAERLSVLVDLQRLIGRIHVICGDPGIGKTSLLRAHQRLAEERGVLCIWVTAGEEQGLVAQIAEGVERAVSSWPASAAQTLRERLQDITLTLGVPGVATVQAKSSAQAESVPRSARALEELVRSAAQGRKGVRGVIFFVDEIQDADPEGLRALAYAWQHLQAEGSDVPAAVYAAGLPHAIDRLAKAVRFSERFAYRSLDLLPRDAQMAALRDPAQERGVVWEEGALAHVLARAGGYPYAVQVYGDAAWQAAGYPGEGATIGRGHVEAADAPAVQEMRLFHARHLSQRTERQRRLLVALAWAECSAPEGVERSALHRSLGVSARSTAAVLRPLVARGLVGVDDSDRLRIALHGFADYIRDVEPAPREPGARGVR